MAVNGGVVMSKQHLNHIAINKGEVWYIFERMGKDIPFSLYPIHRHLGKGYSSVPSWDIEVIE